MIRPIRLYGVGEAGITARNDEGEIKHQYGFHECCSFIVVKNKGGEARLDSGSRFQGKSTFQGWIFVVLHIPRQTACNLRRTSARKPYLAYLQGVSFHTAHSLYGAGPSSYPLDPWGHPYTLLGF